MASQCIIFIHSCHFQLKTLSSSSRRQSEESCRSITRACRLPLIPSKKKFMIDVPSVCSNQKSHDPSRKLQARSMLISSLSAPADRFSPPPPTGEKLDQWMKQSIIEIVNHIQDAPFVHYVFDKKSPLPGRWQKVPAIYISREGGRAEESWGILRNYIANICPDAMIYVQKLNSECKCKYCSAHGYSRRGSGEGEQEEGSTDMWGLIIQGRGGGVSCCASYILKTTRFVSANGCWTQFSLVKAKCFGECPCTQFIRSWLFQSHQV